VPKVLISTTSPLPTLTEEMAELVYDKFKRERKLPKNNVKNPET
jgi:hypothetical protein